ncbi:tripartite tricarboxylate transporter substrate binding protein [Variovorax paradoxus]|jgi:tripartite-type tricarboxylate transporter receptor subunit TctC|uniref:tripartite tricarboxylate transporter substrate binding protein n=1 Tax=Variovorax paradoxus TaxID=34073 RepID=UPI0029C932BC|nr:tripartite tricarboxylate transporter substrate binding protein [Variovorax paradoxus]WPH23076.1 tripartite tricarboxylate transporter substrate binding protein [Variovorax paradoxus]
MKSLLAMLLMVGSASLAVAQEAYPAKPVTAIVGYLPGGAADLVMRKLAAVMAPKFPAGLIVDNKPGVGGSLAVSTLSKAKPDGYQFAFVPNSNLALSPQVHQLSYKSPDDVLPVINIVSFSPVMLVPTDSPYKTLQDLLQAARKSPEGLSVGFPGVTTLSHLNLLELQRAADVRFINVAQKGWGEGGPQLLGGHITAAIAQPIEAVPYLKSGKLRALGSFSETRQSGLPDVPTMKEQGQSVDFGVRYLLIVPKGTPAGVVKYIHDAAKAAMETPEFKKFTADNALDISYQDGSATREAAWEDYRKYTSVLKQSGLLK